MNVRDWVAPMLKVWAAQKIRILTGHLIVPASSIDPETGVHLDGWPAISITAAMADGGRGGPVHQHFPEVYSGDGLIIWRAMDRAPGEVIQVIHVHYLSPPPAEDRAARLGVSRAAYWSQLDRAYFYLAGRLEQPTPRRLRQDDSSIDGDA